MSCRVTCRASGRVIVSATASSATCKRGCVCQRGGVRGGWGERSGRRQRVIYPGMHPYPHTARPTYIYIYYILT